jgi:polyisoprenoid-binding protein YceI
MTIRFRLDPGRSRFTVQGFAGGLLSVFAHSPTFAVRDFAGEVRFDHGPLEGGTLRLTVRADSLDLVDQVRPEDRRDIEGRMRQEVLQTAGYPEIRFEADVGSVRQVGQGQYQLRISGRLSLRGVTRPHELAAQMLVYDDGIRLAGECPLSLPEYRIEPVTALGGAIKLKDQLRVAFDLLGLKEAP